MPKLWGWMMEAAAPVMCQAIYNAAVKSEANTFRYLELGIGMGQTMKAVCEFLDHLAVPFEVNGLDLANDPHNTKATLPETLAGYTDRVRVVYDDNRNVRQHFEPQSMQLIFIDGCHCYECVKRDFEQVETLVAPRGMVVFHDVCTGMQGAHNPQTFHEHRPLEVRRAISDLGLFAGTRPGWWLVADMHGVATGCAVFACLDKNELQFETVNA
jgi:hypothetical protein